MNDSAKLVIGIFVGAITLFLLLLMGGTLGMGPMTGGFGFAPFFMLLFWGVVIALVVGLVVWAVNQSRR